MVFSPETERSLERIENPDELKKKEEQQEQGNAALESVVQNPSPVPVVDQTTGQAVLNPVQGQQVSVELPLTEEEVEQGLLHKRAVDAVFWAAMWCQRMIKKGVALGVRIVYRKGNQK